MTEEEIRNRGIRCALRHMHSLRVQAAGGKKADFTEPCKDCPEIESCRCNWSITTEMLGKESGYFIDLDGGKISLFRTNNMKIIVEETEKGTSLDIKTKCPIKLRKPGRVTRALYKVGLKVAQMSIHRAKKRAKKTKKEEEFKDMLQLIINIMDECGNFAIVLDKEKILKLIVNGRIGLMEEFLDGIKKELSKAITES